MFRPRFIARRVITVPALLLLCLAAAAPAAAQGVGEILPDPINTRRIMHWADRLELSGPQRLALESIHDDYRRQFRALREGEIAAFLEEMRSLSAGGMPQRDAVVRILERMDQIQGKIALLDARVFDRLQPILTEEQARRLPRVRLARERDRLRNPMNKGFIGSYPPDLSEIFFELNLAPDAVEPVDPLLEEYERHLTADLRRMAGASSRMWLDWYDAMEAIGFNGMSEEEAESDPEQTQRMMEAMEQAWVDLTRKAQDLANGIRELNRRTYGTVAAALREGPQRQFRDAYHRQAYPEIASVFFTGRDWIERALRHEELTDEQRQAVEAALAHHRATMDLLMEKAVKVIDEHRENNSPFDYDEESWRAYYEKINELQQKAAECVQGLRESVSGVLGKELMAKIDAADTDEGRSGSERTEEMEDAEATWSDDGFLPARISHRDIRRYAARLELDEGAAATLDAIHMDYIERFKGLKAIGELTEARGAMWGYDEATGSVTPPTDKIIDAIYRLRREAFEAIRGLDDAFFEDARIAVIAESKRGELDRLRATRLRRTYCCTASWYSSYDGQPAEGEVDLGRLVDEQQLCAEDRRRIEEILDEYDAAAVEALRARYEALLHLQEASERMNAAFQRAAEEGASPIDHTTPYRQRISPLTERLNATKKTVDELNRRTLRQLIAALDGDAGHALRREYNRRAFPSICNDQGSAERYLSAALALADLTGHQRSQLNDLAASYRPEYERLSREMIELRIAARISFADRENVDWQEWQRREEEMQMLRFDRDELSEKARCRLRAVLRAHQLGQIGLTDDS